MDFYMCMHLFYYLPDEDIKYSHYFKKVSLYLQAS